MAQNINDLLFGTVAPALGTIVATCLFLAPLKVIRKIQQDKALGEFNPIPFPVTCANCIAWIAYGYVTKNWWMFPPNVIGLIIATWMTFVTYGYASEKVRDTMLAIYVGAEAFLVALGIFTTQALSSAAAVKTWGFTAVAILMVFYSSPLSTLSKVVQLRDSSSLFFPTCLMALINSSLWVAYGLVVGDYFVYAPNGAGMVLSTIQLALIYVFPAKSIDKSLRPRRSIDEEVGDASPLLLDHSSSAGSLGGHDGAHGQAQKVLDLPKVASKGSLHGVAYEER